MVNHHLLRQGWGTYGMAIDSSYDTFKAGWQSEWEKDLPDETMRARYNNLRKIRLVSNRLGYGPCPEPDEEVEQHITLNAEGQLAQFLQ